MNVLHAIIGWKYFLSPTIQEPGIPGWFPRHELEFLYKTILKAAPVSCLELGAFSGRSTYCIALALQTLQGNRSLVSVDRFMYKQSMKGIRTVGKYMTAKTKPHYAAPLEKQDLRACMNVTFDLYPFMKDIVEIHQGDTQSFRLPDRTFDLAFIDADHRYEGVKKDIATARSHMPNGGLICFHDYSPRFPGVRKAVDELTAEDGVVPVDICHTLRVVRLLPSTQTPSSTRTHR